MTLPVEFHTSGVLVATFQMAAAAFVVGLGNVAAAAIVAVVAAYTLGVATSASTTAQGGESR